MLPLVGSVVTMRSARWATILIGACIIVPQLVVAALSPWIGQRADLGPPGVSSETRRKCGAMRSVMLRYTDR